MFIHEPALVETRAAFVHHGLTPTNPQLTRKPQFSAAHEAASSIIHQAHSARINEGTGAFDATCRLIAREVDAQRTVLKYQARMNSPALAQSKLDFVFDFPRTYLSALERIVYPDWYLACFLGDYRNSSVWGHYGDHHKGACLVFGAGGSQADPHLRLKQVVGSSSSRGKDGKIIERLNWDYQPLPFYKVKYTQGIGELDFFRSIGTIPVHDLLSIWYTDKAGNRTNCSDHVRSKDELSWRAKYWDRFYRDITIKSKDWEYEGETRLILLSSLINLNDVNLRKLKYEFRALKEIIFGLNMDDRDKAEILDIILKKCKETNRTDFKFYQAFYDHGTGQIAKTKIDVNFQGS